MNVRALFLLHHFRGKGKQNNKWARNGKSLERGGKEREGKERSEGASIREIRIEGSNFHPSLRFALPHTPPGTFCAGVHENSAKYRQ